VSTQEAQEPAIARRQDPELIAVPMTDEQQQLFGWLGLNPALLLEEPPESDNVVVRVVRPGEDEQEVLEAARQQLAASSGRRRRRGGRGGRSGARNGVIQPTEAPAAETPVVVTSSALDESAPLMVEITPLEAVTNLTIPEPEPAPISEPAEPKPVAVAETAESEEPRRRRRRSSAVATV
jgi:ribonuclease E